MGNVDKTSDLLGFYSDSMGFIVIQWDLNGIYPLVNVYIAMEISTGPFSIAM